MQRHVTECINEHSMFNSGDSVLVAFSGGPDSMALLDVLARLAPDYGLSLGAAHLNHMLRGPESDKDQAFAEGVAKQMGIPFYTKKFNVKKYKTENRLSEEEAARTVRYEFFESVATEHGFNRIAIGHNKDDNAELFLMNLLRGSGPLGLSGIPPIRDDRIVRPLMRVTRDEIMEYIQEQKLGYVVDSTNFDEKYLRNKIRLKLLPGLADQYNPRIIDALDRLATILKSEEDWINSEIESLYSQVLVAHQANRVELSIDKLIVLHQAARRRVLRKGLHHVKGDLRRITFSHVETILSLLTKGRAFTLDMPGQLRIEKAGDLLVLEKKDYPLRDTAKMEKAPVFSYTLHEPTDFPLTLQLSETGNRIEITVEDFNGDIEGLKKFGPRTACLDFARATFPLTIRSIAPGDKFSPIGMKGAIKVNRFFINEKMTRQQRSRAGVVTSQDKIAWVIGKRIAEPFKADESTLKILKIELFLA